MNRLFFTAILILSAFAASAQAKGYAPVKDVKSFQAALSKSNAAIQTISSDFRQTKNLSLLSDKIKSKGKFYFKKEDKVRIEYISPYYYLLVMNGGQLMVKDEQKTTKVNTGNSKMMQSVNRVMIDCMKGTVFQNPDFVVTAYENGNNYLLSLVPANAAMKKMFRQIDVYMKKSNLDVNRLTMTEQNGDYTDMDFVNTQHNSSVNETLFKIK